MNEGQFGVTATRVDVNLVDGHSGGSKNPDTETNIKKVPVALKSESVLKSTSTRAVDQVDDIVQPAAPETQSKPEEKPATSDETTQAAEAQHTLVVEISRKKETVDKERGFVGDFVADLLTKQLKLTTEEQKNLVNKLRKPDSLSSEDRKTISELIETQKGNLNYPPTEYFTHVIQKAGVPPNQAEYVVEQLKFLLEYYYGKEAQRDEENLAIYKESSEDAAKLNAAAECFGLLTGGEDMLGNFGHIAELFGGGAVSADDFKTKLEGVKGMSELNGQRILSPQDLESVQNTFGKVFDGLFEDARLGAFAKETGIGGKLKFELTAKWVDTAIANYKERMKTLQEEQAKCYEELQKSMSTKDLLNKTMPPEKENESDVEKKARAEKINSLAPVLAAIAQLDAKFRSLTTEIGTLRQNIFMLEEGRKGKEKSALVMGEILGLYRDLPTATPGRQGQWLNLYSMLMGGSPNTQELNAILSQKPDGGIRTKINAKLGRDFTGKMAAIDKSGAAEDAKEKRTHLAINMGVGLVGVIALMTIMQVVNGMQQEPSHAG